MELTEKQIEQARTRMIEGVQVSEILIRDLASILAPAPQPVDVSLLERAWRAYERVMGAKGYTCTTPQGTKDGHAAFGEVVAVVQADHEAEVAKLRNALIQAGRNAGCLLADDVSTDFLMHVPDEIAALKAAHVKALAEQRDVLCASISEEEQEEMIESQGSRMSNLAAERMDLIHCWRRAQLDKPEPNALQKFVSETYGTIEALGADKYHEYLGIATAAQDYFISSGGKA